MFNTVDTNSCTIFPSPLLDAPVVPVSMSFSCEHFAINRQVQVVFRIELKLITEQMYLVCQYSQSKFAVIYYFPYFTTHVI